MTPDAPPPSPPPSSAGSRGGADAKARGEQFIWRQLVPRLVHPSKREITEALIREGRALSVSELAPLVPSAEGNMDLIRYHVKFMVKAGALEIVAVQKQAPGEVPRFYFPLPE